jgi:hypothetical protein
MKKFAITAISVLALSTAGAMAQMTHTETDTSVQSTTDPASNSSDNAPVYKSHRSKTVRQDGTERERSSSYSRSGEGVRSSSYERTKNPDGSEMSTSHQATTAPDANATTTDTTTTQVPAPPQ